MPLIRSSGPGAGGLHEAALPTKRFSSRHIGAPLCRQAMIGVTGQVDRSPRRWFTRGVHGIRESERGGSRFLTTLER